jgi:MFS family permease
MNEKQLWTKDFVIISAINFFIALNYFLLMIIISDFAMNAFKASTSEAGLAAGIFIFGALVARLLAGKWIGHIGHMKILYAGLIFGLVTTCCILPFTAVTFCWLCAFCTGSPLGLPVQQREPL